jgi:futalosine hydrolase
MKVLIVSATSFEIEPLSKFIAHEGELVGLFNYKLPKDLFISTLVTGVGSIKTAFGLGSLPHIGDFDLLINAGIAGVYGEKLELGEVVEVISDQFGDIGIEESNGDFQSVFEVGLDNPDFYPFSNGMILNLDRKFTLPYKQVTSVSFNTVSGTSTTIANRQNLGKDIESMEGAAFAYAAKCLHIPYLQIRSISNHIIPRDKSKWQMGLAIENLNEGLIDFINELG